MPVEQDSAGLVVQCAAQAVDQRALAGPIWSDQAEAFAEGDRTIDIVERDKAAEPLAQTADFEDRPRGGEVRAHAAALSRSAASSRALPRRRLRAAISPMMPLGATITNPINNNPTINRLSADEIVTVASCWIVPSRTAPMIGPIQLFMPPMTGIATLLTA